LAISRLIPHKGLHYLIKAYRDIQTEKKLVIVGPSFYTQDYEKQLKEIAQNDPRILFLGVQQGKALKELYSNTYIFVHPSEQEGLPLTVLEAASFGRPLLLSDIQAHREMFEDLPFFFKNKDVKDLRKKLEFLLESPAFLYQKAKKIKRYSGQKYNWEQVVERIVLRYA
jgi:glycosyltransferase involved in cell wall biosynthesis